MSVPPRFVSQHPRSASEENPHQAPHRGRDATGHGAAKPASTRSRVPRETATVGSHHPPPRLLPAPIPCGDLVGVGERRVQPATLAGASGWGVAAGPQARPDRRAGHPANDVVVVSVAVGRSVSALGGCGGRDGKVGRRRNGCGAITDPPLAVGPGPARPESDAARGLLPLKLGEPGRAVPASGS